MGWDCPPPQAGHSSLSTTCSLPDLLMVGVLPTPPPPALPRVRRRLQGQVPGARGEGASRIVAALVSGVGHGGSPAPPQASSLSTDFRTSGGLSRPDGCRLLSFPPLQFHSSSFSLFLLPAPPVPLLFSLHSCFMLQAHFSISIPQTAIYFPDWEMEVQPVS